MRADTVRRIPHHQKEKGQPCGCQQKIGTDIYCFYLEYVKQEKKDGSGESNRFSEKAEACQESHQNNKAGMENHEISAGEQVIKSVSVFKVAGDKSKLKQRGMMFEEIFVNDLSFSDASCRMQMLEFVYIDPSVLGYGKAECKDDHDYKQKGRRQIFFTRFVFIREVNRIHSSFRLSCAGEIHREFLRPGLC